MANAIPSSINGRHPDDNSSIDDNLASAPSSSPVDTLPDELLQCEIFERIPSALKVLSRVSRRFNKISKDAVRYSKCYVVRYSEFFNGFSKDMQNAIREKIEKLSPDPRLPVTGVQLQILAYSTHSQKLTEIGLAPAAIGFTEDDLDSYLTADRFIEAKNFCLFCSRIPGIKVKEERLNTKEGILKQEMSCRQQFNTHDLTAITFLDLHNLGLTRLPTEIGQLTALQRLRLSNNLLTTLPESIGQLPALQWLILHKNLLTALPESIGNLVALQTLYLQDNHLETLPESIRQLTALQTLNIQTNRLQTLPESIRQLTALQGLSLSNNLLTALPESIGQLTALERLYLNDNRLTALPESIGNLVALQELYLQNNHLETLPESIRQLPALRTLNIQNNPVTASSGSFLDLGASRNSRF